MIALFELHLKERKVGHTMSGHTNSLESWCIMNTVSPHLAKCSSELCVTLYTVCYIDKKKHVCFVKLTVSIGTLIARLYFWGFNPRLHPPLQFLVSNQSAPMGVVLSLYRWASYTALTICFYPELCVQACHCRIHSVYRHMISHSCCEKNKKNSLTVEFFFLLTTL